MIDMRITSLDHRYTEWPKYGSGHDKKGWFLVWNIPSDKEDPVLHFCSKNYGENEWDYNWSPWKDMVNGDSQWSDKMWMAFKNLEDATHFALSLEGIEPDSSDY